MKAIVETYFINRGFGFLKAEDGKDYFFHSSNFNFKGKLILGMHVTFELGDPVRLGQRQQAVNITPVSAGSSEADAIDVLAGSTTTSNEVKS